MSLAEQALSARLGEAAFGASFRGQMPVGRQTADFGSYDARTHR